MKFLEHELAYRQAMHAQVTRREALAKMGAGIGSIGLASMFGGNALATDINPANPLAPKAPHFAPKAKRPIQMFMPRGPTPVDTLDHNHIIPKPHP